MLDALVPGSLIHGRYRLKRELGRGGMGVVWSARDEIGDRPCALKFLVSPNPDAGKRLLRETRALAALTHPAIVEFFDTFVHDDRPAFAMELLAGETLRQIMTRDAPLSPARAARILEPVAEGLAAAHALGVVHRDLKPENVFVRCESEPDGIKVLDFGLAKMLEGGEAEGSKLTALGALLGTPWYMAPEQALGASQLTPAVDAWAVGVVLYEAIAGFRPIEGQSQREVVRRLLTTAVQPLESVVPGVPAALAELVGRLLIRRSEDRLSDLGVVAALLRGIRAA